MKNNSKLFEVVKFESCETENVLGYIKDMLGHRDSLLNSGKLNVKDFAILGEVNGVGVFCTPRSTVKEVLETYEKHFKYEKLLNLFDFFKELTNSYYEEKMSLPKEQRNNDLAIGSTVYLNKDLYCFKKNTKAVIIAKEILYDDLYMYLVAIGDSFIKVLDEDLSKEIVVNVNSYIDHTNLSNTATHADIENLCLEANNHGFATVCVAPIYVSYCTKILESLKSKTKVCTVIGFPEGYSTINVKAAETVDAINNGAKEIDYVLCINHVKEKNWGYIEREMKRITEICHHNAALCKVILETCLLTDDEIKEVCSIAKKVGIDFVKTSTGFSKSGATIEAVKLMSESVKGSNVKVKASGGIRTREDALNMIKAGASRIGTSAGVSIVE